MYEKVIEAKKTLDEVEEKLKDILHENANSYGGITYSAHNEAQLVMALRSVQGAITELLQIR